MRPGTRHVSMRVFLTDFGLAKDTATGSKFTRSGQTLGTPAYMPPEQARGDLAELTPTGDVWALGCVLYEALSGRQPFEAESTAALIGAVLTAEPPHIGSSAAGIPAGASALVAACLAKNPGHRPADAAALRDDLDRVLAGQAPRAGRRPVSGILMVAAAIFMAAGVVFWEPWPGGSEPAAPARAPEDELAYRAAMLRHDDPRAAAGLLARALDRTPARHDWRIEQGLLLWTVGEREAAAAAWGTVPLQAPEGRRARLYRGLSSLLHYASDPHRAAEGMPDLEQAARGTDAIAQLARGALAAAQMDFPAAQRTLHGQPGWEAALLRATIAQLSEGGRLDVALQEYDRAMADGPRLAWAYGNRGRVRHRLGDRAGARADYELALRLSPGLDTALNNRGLLRQDEGDLAGALLDYTAAIDQDTGDPVALFNRADCRKALGDLEGALEDYTAALERRPGDPNTLNNRGNLRMAMGNPAGALADFTAALESAPGDPELHYNRARVLEALGDQDGALAGYDRALALRPEDGQALHSRGLLRKGRGDLAGALDDMDAALPHHPEPAIVQQNRALIRWALDDLEGAESDLRQAVAAQPQRAVMYANLGLVLQDREKWAEAVTAFRRFLELAPGHAAADTVRRRLRICEAKLAD